ncbi:MAG: hypothetical protein JRI96_05465 [Deltaproteobacteria bacterium]|nr:hypothetical protein [Deltaproteobacteria bacterium]
MKIPVDEILDCYRTKDLAEASFLYASNKKLIRLDNQNGKVWFVFEDKLSCEDLSNTFWRKEAVINAKDFADSIRTLKALIFNRERLKDG